MIQSVDRALKLLAIVASHKDWIGVREIARMAGLKAPTCQNLLKTLQANGFLEFNAATRRYRVGLAVFSLAESIDPIGRMRDFAKPYVESIFAGFDETVAVLTLYHGKIVVVDWRCGDHPLSAQEPRRVIDQAHFMASGQVLLAYADELFRRNYMEKEFRPNLGKNVPATPAELDATLARVRSQGYAVTADACGSGIAAVSAPVFDATGAIAMAVACSAPLARFDKTRRGQILGQLLDLTREMTTALGGNKSEIRISKFEKK